MASWQDPRHTRFEIIPIPGAIEIVKNGEPAAKEVVTEVGRFVGADRPRPRLAEIENRVAHDVRAIEWDHRMGRRFGVDVGDLGENAQKVALRAWVIVRPSRAPPRAVGLKLHAGEGKVRNDGRIQCLERLKIPPPLRLPLCPFGHERNQRYECGAP